MGIYIRNDVWDVFGDNKFYCLDVSSLFVIVSQITKHENLTPHAKKALVEIAMKIENPITNLNTQYRELAIDYIEDQNILEYIAQDIDDNVLVRSHAIRKLKDQEVLVNIYLNDRSLLLRKKAIYGITDLNFLTKILKEVRIEFEIREAAKLRREKLLVNRILQKDEMIPKNSKQTKNEIENVKTKTSDKTFENDNDTFKSVIIGNQEWLVDNLNVGRFKNGDPLKIANNTEEWILAGKLREPAFCYYDFNPANGDSFGKLYNWFAVNDIRGLAPEGWSIPSNDDWIQLANCLGGEENAGGRLKGDIYWTKKDAKNIMDTGFQGLPGGICFWGSETKFDYIGQHGYWWTSTEYDTSYAISRSIFFFSPELFIYNDLGKESGMSVRCIKKI